MISGPGKDEWHGRTIQKYLALDSSSKEILNSVIKGNYSILRRL